MARAGGGPPLNLHDGWVNLAVGFDQPVLGEQDLPIVHDDTEPGG
jgi:hypothetical protein